MKIVGFKFFIPNYFCYISIEGKGNNTNLKNHIMKLTFSNVVKELKIIHAGSYGFEYIAEDKWNEGKWNWEPKSTMDREKETIPYVREANKELGQLKKGIRALIKVAKKGPGAMAMMAKGVTGNGVDNASQYFFELYKRISNEDLIKLGEGETLMVESYVNGSYECWIK